MVAPGSMHDCSWGACIVAHRGHAWLLRGACMVAPGGHAWLLGGVCVVFFPDEVRSMSRQYTSYWNAIVTLIEFFTW